MMLMRTLCRFAMPSVSVILCEGEGASGHQNLDNHQRPCPNWSRELTTWLGLRLELYLDLILLVGLALISFAFTWHREYLSYVWTHGHGIYPKLLRWSSVE